MLAAQNLARRYGNVVAAEAVSFEIQVGEVVGLLGHNGAGKTTVMKMLTGYLEPDAGDTRVDGLSLHAQRRAIQRRIGYLPENCPIYPDMSVMDYLHYQAVLHRVPARARAAALRAAIERTDLTAKALDPVATLSRGYRQRVGVAQAILHQPDVVILDEPTNGLDPAQVQSMRSLIRSLAQRACVLISSHVLHEVQAVCDRVLIMRAGRIALDARLSELGNSPRLLVTVDAPPEQATPILQRAPGVRAVEALGSRAGLQRYAIVGDQQGGALAPRLARHAHDNGLALHELAPEVRDLETVFAEINAGVAAAA